MKNYSWDVGRVGDDPDLSGWQPAPEAAMRDTLRTAPAPMTWGTTYIIATELLPADRPLLIAVLRALPIGLLLIALTRQLPTGIWWGRMLILGALNIGIFFALLFVAATRLPGGVAATLGAIQPLLVLLLAWPLLHERPTRNRLAAATAGVIGVGLIVIGPAARLDAIGIIAATMATLSMALGNLLTRRWGRSAPLMVFTAWQLVAGGILLLPVALLIEGPPPIFDIRMSVGFIYLGIVNTGIAYALWFRGIERLSPARVAFLGLLSPVVAVLMGFALLGQQLSGVQLFGMLVVLASILAAQLDAPGGIWWQRWRRPAAVVAAE
ncbi:MAG TPA: EamA family transporter [Roseiflexaceae bacterium]|nr:EamA family transporter [Roseiflexaceae bacterium]HMP42554.1 EamA family transporter [Roseiflexaceae bacterium]